MPKKKKRKNKKNRKSIHDARGEFRYVGTFIGGKRKWMKERLILGVPEEEFMQKYADDIFLVQEGRYDILEARRRAPSDLDVIAI